MHKSLLLISIPTHPVARGLKFGLSLHLHPYFVYASSEGSGKSNDSSEPLLLECKTQILCAGTYID